MNKIRLITLVTGVVLALTAPSISLGFADLAPSVPGQQVLPEPTTPKEKLIVGKVLETMDSGGYTYLNLETTTGIIWVAVPPFHAKVGEEVELLPGIEMGEHYSKSLQRKFSAITFSEGPTDKQKAKNKQSAHAGLDLTAEKAAGRGRRDGKVVEGLKVEKAAGADAYSVVEVFQKRTDLAGKTIHVRGQVVKVSTGIMAKTWVHVNDGSGDAAAGTDHLVITTQERPLLGDVVTVTGKLAMDKDFGGGYFYTAIIEEGSFKK